MEEVGRRCTLCKADGEWRLQLRDCGHVVCAPCGLKHLTTWVKHGRARIKCPKRGCAASIHPNDIDALLDDDNRLLQQHITQQRLERLRNDNANNVVTFALGGKSRVRRCPNCLVRLIPDETIKPIHFIIHLVRISTANDLDATTSSVLCARQSSVGLAGRSRHHGSTSARARRAA